MAPNESHGVQQEIVLSGVPDGKGDRVKMRFKVSYQIDNMAKEEQGDVASLGIS